MNYQELSQYENLYVGRKRVAGELASWAIQQSPYPVPDNIGLVVARFQELWPVEPFKEIESMRALEAAIHSIFPKITELLEWNNRKNGRDGMGFSSRYGEPSPDDDFIDLDALARNIAMSVWRDCVDFKKFNDKFDADWAARKLEEGE